MFVSKIRKVIYKLNVFFYTVSRRTSMYSRIINKPWQRNLNSFKSNLTTKHCINLLYFKLDLIYQNSKFEILKVHYIGLKRYYEFFVEHINDKVCSDNRLEIRHG